MKYGTRSPVREPQLLTHRSGKRFELCSCSLGAKVRTAPETQLTLYTFVTLYADTYKWECMSVCKDIRMFLVRKQQQRLTSNRH